MMHLLYSKRHCSNSETAAICLHFTKMLRFTTMMETGSYHGKVTSFNFDTGKWTVFFYEDKETTEVTFPDKEVHLV